VDLCSGEVLRGEIRSGDEHGFTLASPLLGTITLPLDKVAGLRFLLRLAQMAEPPDLRAAEATDVVHLAGGDRLACTIESFSDRGVRVESATHERLEVAYARMTALRVMSEPAKKGRDTLVMAVLRDGSQVTGAAPTLAEGRLRLRSVSGFEANAALTDVVAAHVLSDRFSYLSDVAASRTEVNPFWKPVAGDPVVLYAPRMDRSFTGRSLRCGGKAWVKGVGVHSGTALTWDLAGGFSQFRAAVGVDDGAGPLGAVVFEVEVDGKAVWSSGLVRAAGTEGRGKAGPVDVPPVDVKGAKSLTLRVLSGDAEDPWPVADEADWLGAMLVR
jgi:hypothetical protein